MTTHKVAELTGAMLDAAVAKAEGFASFWIDPGDNSRNESCVLGPARAEDSRFDWCPSSAWGQGGLIIERERMNLSWASEDGELFFCTAEYDLGSYENGPTPLIAAMRAYVASKFGETVELP